MNTKIITQRGKRILEEKIIKQKEKIKEIQSEKEIAYSSSGDGWHDNPGFNNLMLAEEMAIKELKKMETELSFSLIFDNNVQNDQVSIGSIVKFKIFYFKTNTEKELIFEIVGNGESDINNKLISYNSPLGLVLLNCKIRDEKIANIPAGKIKINILKIYKNWEEIAENNTISVV
ncbi:MAG TPA: GreA/GreB family elongation factor [Melioribacteraceae bacterium]|nr:GreA/GreB family elongation factor [Melioribacteraceae bacterium]